MLDPLLFQVDHTIITYLMSPDNEMEHYYTQRITQDVMTEDIRRRIIGHQKKNMTAFQQFLDDPWGYLNPEKKK